MKLKPDSCKLQYPRFIDYSVILNLSVTCEAILYLRNKLKCAFLSPDIFRTCASRMEANFFICHQKVRSRDIDLLSLL